MGELYLIGIGPGNRAYLTNEAEEALDRAEILCGYTVYVDLMRAFWPDKEVYTTPMTKELDRCRWALEQCSQGKRVALICSGDAGVYGMAGPVLEMAPSYDNVEIMLLPGITAALSGAALLGAPLMNDFCVISLSDRLTPWEMIERRLRGASEGDFVICLYNPASMKRRDHLKNACDIILEYRPPETVCGYVRNIGREGQEMKVLSLGQLKSETVDMFTTVFIGNSQTIVTGGKLVTRRGYRT